MGDAAARMRMTEEEYLAFERASDEKHEFADGEIFAMAGGTFEHSTVAQGIGGVLRAALQGRRCTVQNSDMKVYIPSTGRYVYPDAVVVCGRPEFRDDNRDVLLNPRVVVEVLSPTSEAYDRGDKFANYRSIPSLKQYVIVSQDKPYIEVYTRQDDGAWGLRDYGAGQTAALPAIECAIEVDQVYAGVFEQYDDE